MQPHDAMQFSELASANLQRLTSALTYSFIVMLFVALATLLAAQLLKLFIRYLCHTGLLWNWVRSKESAAEVFLTKGQEAIPSWLKSADHFGTTTRAPGATMGQPATPTMSSMSSTSAPDTGSVSRTRALFRYLSHASRFLPRDLYMKQIQNLVQRVLEHPSAHANLFPYLAHGAALDDQAIAYYVDAISRRDPAFMARLQASGSVPPPGGAPAAVAPAPTESAQQPNYVGAISTAQDNIAATVERNLDDLQIKIAFWWPFTMRAAALGLGIIIAIGASLYLIAAPTPKLLLALIGLGAGYIASLVYDSLTIIGRLRSH